VNVFPWHGFNGLKPICQWAITHVTYSAGNGIYPIVMAKAWKSRIEAALAEKGMSMKEASLKMKRGETFVRDMLERDRDPSITNFTALARVLGKTVAELLNEPPPVRTVPVVGLAGAAADGAVMYAEGDGWLGEVSMPPGGSDKTVALEVRGSSMRGIAEDGWFVYYDERRDPPTEDLLGQICVVGLADGRILVKKLIRGRRKRHFDLESAAAPTLYDQRVDWAAEVKAIVPRSVALRLAKGE
jgi:hypothetical protein